MTNLTNMTNLTKMFKAGEWVYVGEYDRIADKRRPLEMLAVAALERADAERENLRQRVWEDDEE